jgi:hypothetical protein
MREAVTSFGADANLANAVTGNWLGPASALLPIQSTRQTFLSDTLLAPLGVSLNLPRAAPSPWQGAPIEISSFWTAILIFLGLWLVGQLLVAFYFIQCSRPMRAVLAIGAPVQVQPLPTETSPRADDAEASDPPDDATGASLRIESGDPPALDSPTARTAEQTSTDRWRGPLGIPRLALRLTGFSLVLGFVVLLLRLPLGAAVLMTVFSGGAGAGILFALVGGFTLWAMLWFLTSVYFASEGIIFEGQPVWRSTLQSLLMIRGQVLATFGLVLTINVVLLGFRAVWGLIGGSPMGALAAILGNGFLTTGVLLAIFVYFGEMRRRWQVREAQAFRSLLHRNPPRDR